MGGIFVVKLWQVRGRRNSDGGCGDCEMRAGILEDTLPLRVARSGTKVAATVIRILASHDLITMSAT